MHLERLGRLALALALSCGSTGCVHVYQPMSGLYRPVVVDTGLANFEDVRLNVHCVPEDLLNPQEANTLCQRIGVLFENQGALVTTTTSLYGSPDERTVDEDGSEEEGGEGEPSPPPTDLTLVLRARKVHEANNLLSWAICIASFTLVPASTEFTFAQDVLVRDGTGFPLVSDSLEGRIVTRYGAGAWIGNTFVDLVARKKEDRLSGDAFDRDLSTDLYRHISQIVFNAKMQWQVLQQTGRPNQEAM